MKMGWWKPETSGSLQWKSLNPTEAAASESSLVWPARLRKTLSSPNAPLSTLLAALWLGPMLGFLADERR
jgi:hypothetical protein